jgi:hypothetical protein
MQVLGDDGTLFDTLAEHARARMSWQLGATAVGGAINAAFFFQHSRLWLGAAFVAMSAYGIWGLADRLLAQRQARTRAEDVGTRALTVMRNVAGAAGLLAVLTTAGTFMAAALGGWNH